MPLARSVIRRIAALRRQLCTAAAGGQLFSHDSIEVEQFNCLDDNYGYLVHDPASGSTAAIDTPEEGPIVAALARRGWRLTHILNTHWHPDHTGANEVLKQSWPNCQVIGPSGEKSQIPAIDVDVDQGDTIDFGELTIDVLNVGGHTKGHVAYHFQKQSFIFVGDALFVLGCGRLFEGPPSQMWQSMQKLMELPDETTVYCAHEYSQANAKWAVTVDPENADLVARKHEIDRARAEAPPKPTVPTTIALEKATNPFLRPASETLRKSMQYSTHLSDEEVWTKVRAHKDSF